VTDPDLPLHVEVLGRAPARDVATFLLIHGYGASRFTWRHWAPMLAELGHVVQIDMKGFGLAPKPDDGLYAPSDQAELVQRLIETRELDNVTVIGHSLGGGVALLSALRLLDAGSIRLSRLVIVAGAAYEQRLPPFVALAESPRLSSLLFRLAGARLIVRSVLRSIVHDSVGVSEEQVRGYADPLASRDAVRVLMDVARQIVPPDLEALTRRYGEIGVPTLLMWGRGDRVVPLDVGQALAEAMPDARLHVLDACGHLPPEERPHESFEVLASFLSDTAGDPPVPADGQIST
jgi:pimeloyl-ACP methyl ester carboxylesterase